MILRSHSENYNSVLISLGIDWESETISISVDKYVTDGASRRTFSADQLSDAILLYKEWENEVFPS